ncbi:hypothetical protein Hanom_Chr07g00586331 [Helianthus anomalus]
MNTELRSPGTTTSHIFSVHHCYSPTAIKPPPPSPSFIFIIISGVFTIIFLRHHHRFVSDDVQPTSCLLSRLWSSASSPEPA